MLEAMDNRGLASDCYKQALICDVHCYEAFEALIQHNMLTAIEGNFNFICFLIHSSHIVTVCNIIKGLWTVFLSFEIDQFLKKQSGLIRSH